MQLVGTEVGGAGGAGLPVGVEARRRPGVTLRSATGRAESVVLDGGYAGGDLIAFAADSVTVAELKLTHSSYHLVHVVPADGRRSITSTRLHRLRLCSTLPSSS